MKNLWAIAQLIALGLAIGFYLVKPDIILLWLAFIAAAALVSTSISPQRGPKASGAVLSFLLLMGLPTAVIHFLAPWIVFSIAFLDSTAKWKKFLHYAFLLALVAASIGPFLWLLSTAVKGPDENVFQYPPRFIPADPTLANFTEVWHKVPMLAFFINSIIVTLLTVVVNISLSVLAAYPLARMRFKGQQVIFLSILATMMIPFQVLMIPLYLICLQTGLTDASAEPNGLLAPFYAVLYPLYLLMAQFKLVSGPEVINGWLGMVLPFAISGFGIFFVRQALVTLPRELEESAVLDGCNSWQVLWHVLLPLIRPTLATLAVFAFMATWGEFLWPSIVLSQPEHFTLPVGLVQLQSAFSANWKLIAAGTILSMIPMLAFFFALQRYFIAGALSGSVKG